jgi:hypothetical protein
VLALVVLAAGGIWLKAAERTRADIKEVMGKAHKGDDSALGKLSKELKGEAPTWTDVQKQVAELKTVSIMLGEWPRVNKPGLERYQKEVAALDSAVGKKDRNAAVEARRSLLTSCFACHYGGAPEGTGGGRK